MIVPVLGGRNGNNTQTNTTTSSGVVPVLQGGAASKVVPVHTQASALSIPKQQPQQNFLQQSGNFLNGVWKGAVGDVGSVLNATPQVPKQASQAFDVGKNFIVHLVAPIAKTPIGKAVGNEAKDFYDVTTNNPNYQKPSGVGIGDLAARGIQNPQVSGAEGIAAKGFSKTGAVIGAAINTGLGALSNIQNNQPNNIKNLYENTLIGAILGGVGGKEVSNMKNRAKSVEQHKPQEVINAVLQSKKEDTPQGKELIKAATVAQQQGKEVQIGAKLTPHDTPEIIAARQAAQAEKSTHIINTPERVQLRKQIEDKLYGTGAKNKNKRIDIVMGLPAAGKSTTLAEPLAKQHGSLLVDSDQVKAQLPEFKGGKGATETHIESSDIAERGLLKRAAKNGDNIVLPLVGKNLEKMHSYVDDFKKLGYDVNLHLNDVSPETAAKRAVTRFNKTGRFVDPHYILNDVGLKPRQNYDILKMRKDITSHGKYSNEGTKPQFLEGSSNYEQPVRSGSDQGTQHQPNTERVNSGTETSNKVTYSLTYPTEVNEKGIKRVVGENSNSFTHDTIQRIKDNKVSKGDLDRAGIKLTRTDLQTIIKNSKEFKSNPVLTAKDGYLEFNGKSLQFKISQEALGIKGNKIENGETLNVAQILNDKGKIPILKRESPRVAEQPISDTKAPIEKPLTPVGTGETKQSTLGKKVEAKAIENKLLKDGIDKLPEYQKANMKEQGKLASDYLASNEKEATDVALGKKSAPDGIIPEAIYTAVENKAIADKNVSLLANLAKSSRVGEATAMGQRIRALGERNPNSPVKNITDLLNRRIKSVEDRTSKPIEKLREEEVSKIKKVQGEQKKPDKYDWSSFIQSISC